MACLGAKSELARVLGDVKARIRDQYGIEGFPMPRFVLVGKQSVGKTRLMEALAGETFASSSRGSRRPTILEFTNDVLEKVPRWFVRSSSTGPWTEHDIGTVRKLVGDAHDSLGESASPEPIYVRLRSSACVDLQIVDLPGFRDSANQDVCSRVEDLVKTYMRDRENIIICVEQCSDEASLPSLRRVREIDPRLQRSILVYTKLDKYYSDPDRYNVNSLHEGFGQVPETLVRFALTLPGWKDGEMQPKHFVELREEFDARDVKEMLAKGLRPQFREAVGFKSFAQSLEKRVAHMFSDRINPVLDNLRELKTTYKSQEQSLVSEFEETDPHRILSTVRECGKSFAFALKHVMEGVPNITGGQMTLENELRAFHEYHQKRGSDHFAMLPSDDLGGLNEYIEYLTKEMQVGAWDAAVTGGAQFRRLMIEVEIFLRFSEITVEIKKQDVLQARGVSMSSLTWRDVVMKLVSNEAHLPLKRRLQYVGERIRWFFECQKESSLDFMSGLERSPCSSMYSSLLWKNVKLINQNAMIKNLIFNCYDQTCARQLRLFMELFDNLLLSTFANPWILVKGGSTETFGEQDSKAIRPSIDDTKERIPKELESRSNFENALSKWLVEIPTQSSQIDDAVDKVQMLVLKTYGFVRSKVCDQVELFTESFFKIPMLRRLEEDMNGINLTRSDEVVYVARRQQLEADISSAHKKVKEIDDCIARLQGFTLKQSAHVF